MKKQYIMLRTTAFFMDYLLFTMFINIVVSVFFTHLDLNRTTNKLLNNLSTTTTQAESLDLLNGVVNLYIVYFLAIIISAIIYYVIVAKLLKGRTLGCRLSKLMILKNNNTPATASDLTLRMLLTNGIIIYLVLVTSFIVFNNNIVLASTIFSIFIFIFAIFVIVNVTLLFADGKSLVDRISKTRPVLIIKSNNLRK